MEGRNDLVSPEEQFCFAKAGEVYVVSLPFGRPAELDLTGQEGEFSVRWYDPREGGDLRTHGVATVSGGSKVALVAPGAGDWVGVVSRE